MLEWSGLRTFAGFRSGGASRALKSLLFTDLVDSTAIAREMGDRAWREALSEHFEAVRTALERHGGAEVKTTGDGVLATFDAPAQALRCAASIRAAAVRVGLQIRAGVHVGEVEPVGADLQGLAVHEAARIMSVAGGGEILASDITRTLAQNSGGLRFEDRGTHTLKGLAGEWRLYAYVGDGGSDGETARDPAPDDDPDGPSAG